MSDQPVSSASRCPRLSPSPCLLVSPSPCLHSHPPSLSRRTFLAGLALSAMLHRDGCAGAGEWSPPTGQPHFVPKAKNVVWLFMNGGVSHMESFDPKPMLTKYAGKTIAETPFKET